MASTESSFLIGQHQQMLCSAIFLTGKISDPLVEFEMEPEKAEWWQIYPNGMGRNHILNLTVENQFLVKKSRYNLDLLSACLSGIFFDVCRPIGTRLWQFDD